MKPPPFPRGGSGGGGLDLPSLAIPLTFTLAFFLVVWQNHRIARQNERIRDMEVLCKRQREEIVVLESRGGSARSRVSSSGSGRLGRFGGGIGGGVGVGVRDAEGNEDALLRDEEKVQEGDEKSKKRRRRRNKGKKRDPDPTEDSPPADSGPGSGTSSSDSSWSIMILTPTGSPSRVVNRTSSGTMRNTTNPTATMMLAPILILAMLVASVYARTYCFRVTNCFGFGPSDEFNPPPPEGWKGTKTENVKKNGTAI
ncbi:hypothetical protein K402DRAFT_424570 [Aulographum hederae CBS 113979]|uniref:Transmembrane protein n=1 Tax=Aulographum hederae CBS 113979 TaxID=1176131 RepID=A0A6G1GP03_9PEZI|nr:hypothetical protein K402DRAFT_424570 [Aulographum hederae CBS 113979]